jgi:hypothetical protein
MAPLPPKIYNEEVRDLLDPNYDHRLIRINERPDGAIVMEGVMQVGGGVGVGGKRGSDRVGRGSLRNGGGDGSGGCGERAPEQRQRP